MPYQRLPEKQVNDLALPEEWNQMIANQDYFNDLLQRGHIPSGLDADKPTNPQVGDSYYATDTRRLYLCNTAGVWDGGLAVDSLAVGRTTAYASVDIEGTLRQKNTIISFRRAVGFGTAWGDTGVRWVRIAKFVDDTVRVHIRGNAQGYTAAFDIIIRYRANASTGLIERAAIYTLGNTQPIGRDIKLAHDGTYVYVVLGNASTAWKSTWITLDVDVGGNPVDADWQDSVFAVFSGTEPTWTQEVTYDQMSIWPASGVTSSTSEFSTTSTAFVDVLTLPVVTSSGRLLVGATAPRLRNDNGGHSITMQLVVGSQADVFYTSTCYGLNPTASHMRVFDLGAGGSYTAKLQAKVSGSTGRVNFGAYDKITLWYLEI